MALLARRVVATVSAGALGATAACCYGAHQQRRHGPAAAQGGVPKVDGKAVSLPRYVSMTCGANCGGLSNLRIVDMEEGRANVDFQAARGFFECYHRCIASRKAMAVSESGAGVANSFSF